MKKQLWMVLFAGAFSAVWLLPQTTGNGIGKVNFAPSQQAEIIGEPDGGFRILFNADPGTIQPLSGRPFSATQTNKTVQTLGDGTEISNSSSTQLYRDVLGRTRTESTVGAVKVVVVRDPVNNFILRMNPDTKEAIRTVVGGRGGRGVAVSDEPRITTAPAAKKKGRAGNQVTNEDLGVETVNGVLATGTRRTQTIPAGQIGNNRDIHVVNERWYSEDLQMLIKTVNSDPRFGVTTYELTDISRDNPDASLFQVPAGYTVTDTPARGGRGGQGVTGTPATVPMVYTKKQ